MAATRTPVTRKEMQDEISKLRDTLDRWRAPIQAEIDKHKKTIYGNGELGLDEIVRNNIAVIAEHSESLKKIDAFLESTKPIIIFYKVGVWFAGLIGASVIALIWGLITNTVTISTP